MREKGTRRIRIAGCGYAYHVLDRAGQVFAVTPYRWVVWNPTDQPCSVEVVVAYHMFCVAEQGRT